MIISQTPEEIQAAYALQSKCELKRVTLRQCHASVEGSGSELTPPFSLRVSHNSVANSPIGNSLRIEGRFQVQGYDSSASPSLLFSIECAFDLEYEIQDPTYQPKPESIAAFKDGNAIFNCWPYAREFVNNLTSRMELHVPALPFLRIAPKAPEPQKPEESSGEHVTGNEAQ